MASPQVPKLANLPLPALKSPEPVVLAPLSGLTDAPFRAAVEAFGAGWTVSEMVASEAWLHGKREAVLRMKKSTGPHVVQLAGREPQLMAEAARAAVSEGAAMIDINMGCPAKRVSGKLCGSGLMREPDLAARLIAAVQEASQVPVSVKMRLGWDEACMNAPELAAKAEELGAAMVTVHGRTRAQFYKGRADWHKIRAVTERVSIPVIANGDLVSLGDIGPMLRFSGAAGVMIGRGALGRPWFIAQAADAIAGRPVRAEPSLSSQLEGLLRQYQAGLKLYGERLGLRHMRSHLEAAMRAALGGLEPLRERRLAVMLADSPGETVSSLTSFYTDLERLGCQALAKQEEAA